MIMFDSSLLRTYMLKFYGFGDYEGKYWFVGMEEGGGNDPEKVARKFANWAASGELELTDLNVSHLDKALPTWGQLIRIILSIKSETTTKEAIVAYQKVKLGRISGENAIIELMPLPSPTAGTWMYSQHSDLAELRSRDTYMARYSSLRARHLHDKIETYKPSVVLFYSFGYLEYWKQVAGIEFTQILIGEVKAYVGRNHDTVFAS